MKAIGREMNALKEMIKSQKDTLQMQIKNECDSVSKEVLEKM